MTQALAVAIVGAGGFGREILQYCLDAQATGWPHAVVGFLDDRSDALEAFDVPIPIIGGFEKVAEMDLRAFIIAVGDPVLRGRLADAVLENGGSLVSLVHPTAYVAASARVGPGTLLGPYTVIAANATVGSNVMVNVYGSIGHDSCIGDHCVISPYAAVLGAVSLGSESFLGTHCTIAPGTTIGRRSKVSVGSVVTRDARPGSLLVGNPAKGRVMYQLDSSI
jgi:sugar O-acyltransferase (sialic acid O-acetyltransferase NeuD family)